MLEKYTNPAQLLIPIKRAYNGDVSLLTERSSSGGGGRWGWIIQAGTSLILHLSAKIICLSPHNLGHPSKDLVPLQGAPTSWMRITVPSLVFCFQLSALSSPFCFKCCVHYTKLRLPALSAALRFVYNGKSVMLNLSLELQIK